MLPDSNTELLYTYNYYNEPTTYVDPDSYTATYGYGGTDGTPSTGSLLVDVICPCNIIKEGSQPGEYQQSWNARGFKKTFTDPNINIVSMSYGTNDTLTAIQFPPDDTGGTSPTVNMIYNNSTGDLLTYEDALAYTTSYTPDNLGRVLSQVAPTGGQISYTYDAAGNATRIEDPVQNLITYHYDPMNRVDWMVAPGNLTTSYTRDADGNITDIIDPDILLDHNHRSRHFIYDNAGRLTAEQWLDGSTVTYQANYTYDAASELTSASDQNGGVTVSAYTFTYDVRGRVASTQENNIPGVASVTLSDQYDANGNRTLLYDNLTPAGTIGYAYGPGNLLGEIEMQAAGANDLLNVTFQYDSQDPEDRLTSIQRSASADNWANTTIGYTNRNLASSIQDSYPNGSANFTYAYDLEGQVQTYLGPDGSMSYGYDPTGQLTVVYGSHPETYGYDLNGNRETANGHTYGTPGPANQLTSDGVYSYTYDNVGNLLTKTGLEGGITTVYALSWDYQNRLVEAKKTQNGGTTVQADDHFTYDVFGRRIGKVDKDGNQLWTVYDGVNPYADFTGTTSLALKTRYLYAPGDDQLLASTHADGNSTVWYLTDLRGSVRVVSGVVGDPGKIGQVTASYDSFGNIIPGDAPYDRFAYTGREWDSEIGLYYYRARYYDPNTSRFVGVDPLGFEGENSNLYRYTENDPMDYNDPFGLDRKPTSGTVVCVTNDTSSMDYAFFSFFSFQWAVGENGRYDTEGDIKSADDLVRGLSKYNDGSIDCLIISGHGSGGFGVRCQGGGKNYIDQNISYDTAKKIAKKLSKNAQVLMADCNCSNPPQADKNGPKLARKLGRWVWGTPGGSGPGLYADNGRIRGYGPRGGAIDAPFDFLFP